MGTVERFEDLVAWQKAWELTRLVYAATREGPFARDFGLSGQVQRAAVSVMSNIAEGFERQGRAEFHQFLTIAKASAGETRSLLYVALDVGYVDQSRFEHLFAAVAETSRVVSGLRTAVSRQRPK